ncbi:cell surface protein [Streptococcus iniae]|uniref:MSCRAMM family protein n=1 Tax=Streptococcus iniae TaxID=1346 RepID=UPI000EF67501|nr:LPXTG cell wall anchor domain-containing protein [Streptococcus iniae]RLV40645.1 cell surface protein [Streptococcus iniae]RLV45522.1 cell surface protein [Streptococcus iniae]
MKKYFCFSKSLLTVATLSSLVLVNGNLASVVIADSTSAPSSATVSTGSFNFVASVVDSKGATLSGKTVLLTDITDGISKPIQSQVSNSQGQAIFSSLPLNRNISVSVDGKTKGYTLRTDQAGTTLASSFTADGLGKGAPSYTNKPLVVLVSNQDAEPIPNKEVILKDRQGNLVDRVLTDNSGLARFTKNLLDGTHYPFYIDGKKMGETIPGISVNTALDTTSNSEKVESPVVNASQAAGSFSFKVTVLGDNGKVLEGKKVSLFDITDGKETALQSADSNASGQVDFDKLPLSRNISVSIDGKAQGYTIRTDKDGQEKAAVFYVSGKGNTLPTYTKTPATIRVVNEDAEPLSGQTVTLFNKLGQKVAELMTNQDGKAIFEDQLMDGTFYQFSVNGIKMNTITPGNSINAALSSDQIKKVAEVPQVAPSNHKKDKQDTTAEPKEVAQKKAGNALADQKQTSKAKEMNPKNKASLPQTGDSAVSILSLVGFVMLGVSTLLLLAKKTLKNTRQ